MTNPVDALLNADNARATAARDLGTAHTSMLEAIAAYRDCWRKATQLGWARNDLLRAGFTDPARLPRKAAQPAKTSTQE